MRRVTDQVFLRRALACVWITACGSSPVQESYADLVQPPSSCREQAPTSVSATEMRRDLTVLERTLRRGYAGFESAATQGEWLDVFANARTQLPSQPVSPLVFRDFLVERFLFLDDNHAGFSIIVDGRRSGRATSGHHQAYMGGRAFVRQGDTFTTEDGSQLLRCDGRTAAEVLRPVWTPGANTAVYRPVVLSRQNLDDIVCVFRETDEQEHRMPLTALDMGAERGAAFERLPASFPWLRLRTLFRDRDTLETFAQSATGLRNEPVVVLDLRGNGGGSDGYLLRWFADFTSDTLRYWDKGRLESEVTLQGALNFWECVRASRTTPDAWTDRRIARARRELDDALRARGLFRELVATSPRLPGRAPQRFDGRLLVVIDRGCLSACETGVLLARQLPGAVIVGENTGGVMKVGETRRYQLPHSRVRVSLGHQSHQDPSGAFRESYGFTPDLWLDGSDPEGDIRALARCLADDECGAAQTYR